MRVILKISIVVALLGLISLSTSCKKPDIEKDETAAFLTSLNNLGTDLTQQEAFNVLNDFASKNPPLYLEAKKVRYNGKEYKIPLKIEPKGIKGGIEDLYGTWEWQDTGWVHVDPSNPPDGIFFRWTYYNTQYQPHIAGVLIDSISTIVIGEDTLPQKIHVALFLDNNKIAEFSLTINYNNYEQITYLKLVFTIINEFQIGLEVKNLQYNQDGDLIAATFNLWIINYRNHNFRQDITLTIRSDQSFSIIYTDSDDWKVTLNVSAPTEINENYFVYRKRTVSGEITKDKRHAADITGTIWEPEDENHKTEIFVIFSDGSREPLSNYITLFGE